MRKPFVRTIRTGQFAILLLISVTSFSRQAPYSLASVPDSIRKNANIVTHLEDYDYEVEDLDNSSLTVHKVFTVLNEEGKGSLFFYQYSSKSAILTDAEIRVYDANGKQTGKYKKKDMSTQAVGEGLIEDGYATYYRVSALTYPVTVEVTYSHRLKSSLSIPPFVLAAPKEGVIQSSYTARIPTDLKFRFKAYQTALQPEITDEGKHKVYKWKISQQKPLQEEEGSASDYNSLPHVSMSLDKFAYFGMQGDLTTWKTFGSWIATLYEGLDVLPPEREQFFRNLVKDAPNDREKVRLVYQYLQQNFRYVSIQLGVGGLKPFPASFTDQKKYGDCKGLSNYMRAVLKAIGIKSHVAIINASYDATPVDPDFPANGFNHVILCVPQPSDSLWLECTSSTIDFGELGTFTENRNALLLTENGGVLIPTPRSNALANKLNAKTTVVLNRDYSAETETIFTIAGQYKETMNSIMKDNRDDQKRAIVFYLGYKQPDAFELAPLEAKDGSKVRLKMALAKVPEFTAGTKWFISPRIHKAWSAKLPKADGRKQDFYFRYPFDNTDTTIFKLPPGSQPEAADNQKDLSCAYASYQSKSWFNEKENAIYSTSRLVLKQHRIPAADYAQVKQFFDDLLQEDSKRLVFKVAEQEKKGF